MKYKIGIKTAAEKDMRNIYRYISETLKEPAIAKRLYGSQKKAIQSLKDNPMRHAVIEDEPFFSQGIRRLYIGNYTAFYIVDDANRQVQVLNVIYSRRDWQNLL